MEIYSFWRSLGNCPIGANTRFQETKHRPMLDDGKENRPEKLLCTCITLLVHFFAVNARLRSNNAYVHVLWRVLRQTTTNFLFVFWTWKWLLGIQRQERSPKFDKERDLVIIALKFIMKRSHFFKNSFAAVRSWH